MRSLLCGAVLLSIGGCGVQAVTQESPARTGSPATVEVKSQPPTAEQPPAAEVASAPPAVAATDEEIRPPATVAEAARVLDLATFPLMPGAKDAGKRIAASLAYEAVGDVKSAFEFQKRALLERGWKELSAPQIFDQSASGEYGKAGYLVSVSIFPRGEAGQVSVRLQNHSHLNLRKLPLPPGAKLQYAFPAVASFETTAGVEETTAAVRKLLLAQGWQPYGSAGDVMTFKQNAVQLSARVLAPPAQPGKSIIDYSATQLSADLPAPADAEHVQYSDQLKQLNLHALGTPDAVAANYQALLAPAGWKSTTETPVKDRVESFMIFRNPQHDLLQLDMWDLQADRKTRVTLRHQTAAEVEEIERQAKLALDERRRNEEEERNKPKAQVLVTLPADARDVQAAPEEIEFQVGTGKAQAALDAIVKELTAAGWQADKPLGAKEAGVLELKKGDEQISIHYVDPGFIPAQITISARGKFDLQRAGGTTK